MSDTFDNILKQLSRWGEIVADKSGFYFKKAMVKGGELTKIGKVQIDIEKIKREINHKYTDLGQFVFQSMTESPEFDFSSHDKFKMMMEDIRNIRSDLDEKYAEKTNIRREGKANEKAKEEEQDIPIGI